jgi:hypothetical protein
MDKCLDATRTCGVKWHPEKPSHYLNPGAHHWYTLVETERPLPNTELTNEDAGLLDT